MDKNNVEFAISKGERGYPAGHFFSAALEIVLNRELKEWEIFCELETMVAHADSRHKSELRYIPNLVETIEATFSGKITRDWAFKLVQRDLITMPVMLPLALPELAEALKEYAQT